MSVVDLLHEFELGVGKRFIIHLVDFSKQSILLCSTLATLCVFQVSFYSFVHPSDVATGDQNIWPRPIQRVGR